MMKSDTQNYILIVDDSEMNLLLTSHILQNEGYVTRTAESGKLCLEEIENELPSLILLDVMMPEMDGYEVCRLIKKNEKWKDIPIVFLTANAHTENLVEGFQAGGVDYITKPFKSEELLVRVKTHLENSEFRKTILEMNKSRDKLYSIIAHDIRSPLSGILQTLDAIDQGFFDPASEDFKEIIKHLRIRTKETNTLLTSLLQWSRLQTGTIVIEPKETDIRLILDSCIALLKANAEEKNIEIVNNLTDHCPCLCDEVSMDSVFRNIISNAIKFTAPGGRITISSCRKKDECHISITDNGVGMTNEIIQTIFEKNQSVSTTGTANEQGTGLGLMIVKDLIRKNNGRTAIESIKNVGTTFTVIIPSV